MSSGIYYIKNIVSNKFYIGSTQNLKARKYYHFNRLKNNKHPNSYLQNAWNKHGASSFVFESRLVDIHQLLIEEQKELDTYFALGVLYNIAQVAGASFRNKKHSIETRRKMKESAFLLDNRWNKNGMPEHVIAKIRRTSTKRFSHRRKLTDADVIAIKTEYNPTINGGVGTRSLAKKYGVSRTTIIHVLRNERYKISL
jgi:group I intron endonuclease